MKIVYGKNLTEEEISVVSNIALECGVLFDTARLLFYRNVDTVEKAKVFLNSNKNRLHNPYLLDGVREAVDRLILAKEKGQNVLIFGDYDADGVCATAVLYNALKDFGIIAKKTIPEREDNYGLNLNIVNKFNDEERIDLLITVDCGISDSDKIEEIKKLGIDVIVTDHHEPPEELPDCIKINPKINGQAYPFKELCGAGVAYKLSYALIGEKANKNLDFVALATIADSMDLVGENRDIVKEGLKLFNDRKTLRLPFKYLLGDYNREVTAQTLAYTIAPRINAGGRMGDALTALSLFTSSNPNEIFDLAVKLENYNNQRQVECDKIYKEAKEKISREKRDSDSVILIADDNWRTGFIGIVAAKLVEDYARPVIVFAGCEGYYKGSARSVEGFNIYDAINAQKDILITFGGHSQAAGVSVSKENFSLLRERINEYIKVEDVNLTVEQKIYAEWEIDKPIDIRFAKELELLEPFGVGNRRPLFVTKVNEVEAKALKVGSPHYSFLSPYLEILNFNGEKDVEKLSFPIEKSVLFELNLSTFKQRESLKGYLRNIVLEFNDSDEELPYKFYTECEKIIAGAPLKNSTLFNNISVNREDFKDYFVRLKELKGKFFKNTVEFAKKYFSDLELLQAIFAIKVFIELNIFEVNNGRFLFNEKVQNALTNSKLYSKIYSLKV